ncbi:universal stress protein [Nocardia mangyaensis]|uniref:universal stress protein n=1 Tax=Nocardia mangyaensis TaxID=2213200 RepID=UPI0026751A60|nr:universal stress protein [Nocardia mangyaensis]MDO3647698.1 universal stress protein [Nocardia mangyaensis]
MSPLGNQNQPVVVGVDGSEQSGFALRWAAEFAAHHRAPLDIVFAIEIPVDYYYGPGLTGPRYDRAALHRQGQEDVADAAATEAAALTTPIADITISTAVIEGAPIPVLRDRSTSARLIVVGSRGLGALRRTLLGSVSTSLARHAECPVAVIPDAPVDAEGPVVVGVDGSACSTDAIGIAFDEAARRRTRLVAVNAWSEFYRYEARSTMQTEAEALLSESLAGYAEKYPEVQLDRVVVEDRPARAVLDASTGAQLIVVGSHGRGGFAGMTLGSVAQAVLHGAQSPVIIARPRSRH